jgi:hypothetical protein
MIIERQPGPSPARFLIRPIRSKLKTGEVQTGHRRVSSPAQAATSQRASWSGNSASSQQPQRIVRQLEQRKTGNNSQALRHRGHLSKNSTGGSDMADRSDSIGEPNRSYTSDGSGRDERSVWSLLSPLGWDRNGKVMLPMDCRCKSRG